MQLPLRPSELRGAARLAVEATVGVTDLVESVHRSVTRLPAGGGEGALRPQRTGGITGLVYRSVRRVTGWVGVGIDSALEGLEKRLELPDPGACGESVAGREAALAALNGVLGDHLEVTANPLAIPMELRRDGRALNPAQERGGRVLLLLHGLCRSDLQWRRNGHDHGAALAVELGLTPVYARYNSGRPIATNGRELAERLEAFCRARGEPVAELLVVAHSMGGLVMRSACLHAEAEGLAWRALLRKIVFLGTPHLGAPLERGGNLLTLALGATSYTAAFARLGRIRSAGITDLRHGRVAARREKDRFARHAGQEPPPPLPRGVACYAIAATLKQGSGRTAHTLAQALLGDGLVPVASAFGDHPDPSKALAIPADHRWIGCGMSHLDLLDRQEVYRQLVAWMRRPAPASPGARVRRRAPPRRAARG